MLVFRYLKHMTVSSLRWQWRTGLCAIVLWYKAVMSGLGLVLRPKLFGLGLCLKLETLALLRDTSRDFLQRLSMNLR